MFLKLVSPRRSLSRRVAACTLVLAACGGAASPLAPHEREGAEVPPTAAATAATPPPADAPLPPVTPVRPSLRVAAPGASVAQVAEQVARVEGVAAAGAIALVNAQVEVSGAASELSVIAVDPVQFRPLAPGKTAGADFVWRRLAAGDLILAHEEQGRLNVALGGHIDFPVNDKKVPLRVAGLAANGLPNLAGAMISLNAARSVGIGEPTALLVGVGEGSQSAKVRDVLKRMEGMEVEAFGKLGDRGFLTGSAAAKLFGSFRYTAHKDGTITPEAAWVRNNIATRRVPILGRVRCHKRMLPQLEGALAELEASGLAGLIDAPDYHYQGGCYVPRFIGRDSSRPLSLHSWGLAIDINVATNPAGARPRQDPRLVAVFERWGFRWGGRWNPPDGHHFELAAVVRQ